MKKIEVLEQITNITSNLIEVGLSEEQNYPSEEEGHIYITNSPNLSVALKNISYKEIYDILEKDKNYNIKMIDGALLQFMYSFDGNDNLVKYRLAFFPSPNLEEFQNNSELYEEDNLYADILHKNIVAVPIRFDYDPDNFVAKEHPSSHLTLGQYKNCRIPLKMPITPNIFIDFILRNFYNTTQREYTEKLEFDLKSIFDDTIDEIEKQLLHLAIGVV